MASISPSHIPQIPTSQLVNQESNMATNTPQNTPNHSSRYPCQKSSPCAATCPHTHHFRGRHFYTRIYCEDPSCLISTLIRRRIRPIIFFRFPVNFLWFPVSAAPCALKSHGLSPQRLFIKTPSSRLTIVCAKSLQT